MELGTKPRDRILGTVAILAQGTISWLATRSPFLPIFGVPHLGAWVPKWEAKRTDTRSRNPKTSGKLAQPEVGDLE